MVYDYTLKVRKNVNLDTLEKYGFRKQYNIWTGEVEKYVLFDTPKENIPYSIEGVYVRVKTRQLIFTENCNSSNLIAIIYDLKDILKKEKAEE